MGFIKTGAICVFFLTSIVLSGQEQSDYRIKVTGGMNYHIPTAEMQRTLGYNGYGLNGGLAVRPASNSSWHLGLEYAFYDYHFKVLKKTGGNTFEVSPEMQDLSFQAKYLLQLKPFIYPFAKANAGIRYYRTKVKELDSESTKRLVMAKYKLNKNQGFLYGLEMGAAFPLSRMVMLELGLMYNITSPIEYDYFDNMDETNHDNPLDNYKRKDGAMTEFIIQMRIAVNL